MLGLYLFVRTVLPALLGGAVAMLGARVINRRLARLPPRVIALPDDSLLPSSAAQRRYRRLRRRSPGLNSINLPPKVPRSWIWLAAMVFIGTISLAVYLTPDGPRFQVMVESFVGYPSTVIEVRAPAEQQLRLLDSCTPVLLQTVRPITMRYRRSRNRQPGRGTWRAAGAGASPRHTAAGGHGPAGGRGGAARCPARLQHIVRRCTDDACPHRRAMAGMGLAAVAGAQQPVRLQPRGSFAAHMLSTRFG